MINLPHFDARTPLLRSDQAALLRFDDAAVMFTASWQPPSLPVWRPGGEYRRQYLVHLVVPHEQRSRAFENIRSITLYGLDDREPIVVEDFGGVHSRTLSGITLALFVDELS